MGRSSSYGWLLLLALVAGCRDGPASEQEARPLPAMEGVRSFISEVSPGRFVIDRELLVDSATVVIVQHRDGEEARIETAEEFAAHLDPPDSLRRKAAQFSQTATSPDAAGPAWDVPETGLPLGTLLFYTMAMNVWRPEAYAALLAERPPTAQEAVPASPGVPAPSPSVRRVTPEARAPAPRVERAAPRIERVEVTQDEPRRGKGKHDGRGRGRERRAKGHD